MKNFIILFEEKEGTSALVRQLNEFQPISILHNETDLAWEPFDAHNCGRMSLKNLKRSFSALYSKDRPDLDALNACYQQKCRRQLAPLEWDQGQVIGFKMRFRPPNDRIPVLKNFPALEQVLQPHYMNFQTESGSYRRLMFSLFKQHQLAAIIAVRQDVLRWALSYYHGNGAKQAGHLQFKLARNKVTRAQLQPIHVDCEQLETIIQQCETTLAHKRRLANDLAKRGIPVHAFLYEDFLSNPNQSLQKIFKHLEIEMSDEAIEQVVSQPQFFQKVHSNQIADFVINHEEVLERFGNVFSAWDA